MTLFISSSVITGWDVVPDSCRASGELILSEWDSFGRTHHERSVVIIVAYINDFFNPEGVAVCVWETHVSTHSVGGTIGCIKKIFGNPTKIFLVASYSVFLKKCNVILEIFLQFHGHSRGLVTCSWLVLFHIISPRWERYLTFLPFW